MQVPASRAAAFYGYQSNPYAYGTPLGMGDLNPSVKSLIVSAPSIVGGLIVTPALGIVSATMWAGLAIPIIGGIVVGVTIGLTALMSRKGPKQKVATTEVVDTAEPLMAENRDGYLSGPRTEESRLQAIENFKAIWQWVVDHCDIPEMGKPGQNCVNERKPGGQWDWWAYYYDPIYNDLAASGASSVSTSTRDTAAGTYGGTSVTEVFTPGADGSFLGGNIFGIPAPLALAGAAALVFALMGDGSPTPAYGRRG